MAGIALVLLILTGGGVASLPGCGTREERKPAPEAQKQQEGAVTGAVTGGRYREGWQTLPGGGTEARAQIALASPDDQLCSLGLAVKVMPVDPTKLKVVLELTALAERAKVEIYQGRITVNGEALDSGAGTPQAGRPRRDLWGYVNQSPETGHLSGTPDAVIRLGGENLAVAVSLGGRVAHATAARLVGEDRSYRLKGFVEGAELVSYGLGQGEGEYPVPIYMGLDASGQDRPNRVIIPTTPDFAPQGAEFRGGAIQYEATQLPGMIGSGAEHSVRPPEAIGARDAAYFNAALGGRSERPTGDGPGSLLPE